MSILSFIFTALQFPLLTCAVPLFPILASRRHQQASNDRRNCSMNGRVRLEIAKQNRREYSQHPSDCKEKHENVLLSLCQQLIAAPNLPCDLPTAIVSLGSDDGALTCLNGHVHDRNRRFPGPSAPTTCDDRFQRGSASSSSLHELSAVEYSVAATRKMQFSCP